MPIPADIPKHIDDIARAVVDDILDSWSLEDVEKLVEEIEKKLRKLH
jgi:hypothetical protein